MNKLLILQNLDAILDVASAFETDSTSNDHWNEMEQYLANPATPISKFGWHDILEVWKRLESEYSIVACMIKNVLAIALANVEVEQIFNFAHDIYNYCQSHLHAKIIKKIMLIKLAHQEKMTDDKLLSDMKLKKKMANTIEKI